MCSCMLSGVMTRRKVDVVVGVELGHVGGADDLGPEHLHLFVHFSIVAVGLLPGQLVLVRGRRSVGGGAGEADQAE